MLLDGRIRSGDRQTDKEREMRKGGRDGCWCGLREFPPPPPGPPPGPPRGPPPPPPPRGSRWAEIFCVKLLLRRPIPILQGGTISG